MNSSSLNKSIRLNPSVKHHLIIGAMISVWGFLFAFFARPFAHGDMDFGKWINVSVGFGLFVFLSYSVVIWTQRLLYKRLSFWNIWLEIAMYILFFVVYSCTTYLLYLSPLINGFYDFSEFLRNIILNIILIVTPLLVVVRIYSLKLIPDINDIVTIKGENKLDILRCDRADLICMSNAQNYVEIFYLNNNELRSKLIRTSLKRLQSELDFLVQVHRSHLINPEHFKSWRDGSNVSLTHMDIPVSKSYKDQLLKIL